MASVTGGTSHVTVDRGSTLPALPASTDEVRGIMKQSERELLIRVSSGLSTANVVARELIAAALEKETPYSTTRVHKLDE